MNINLMIVAILLAIIGLILCVPRVWSFLIFILASVANVDGFDLNDRDKLYLYREILLLIAGIVCIWGSVSIYLSYLQYPTV